MPDFQTGGATYTWNMWVTTTTNTTTMTSHIPDITWTNWNDAFGTLRTTITNTAVNMAHLARAFAPKTREEVLLSDAWLHPREGSATPECWNDLLTPEDFREYADKIQRIAEQRREREHQAQVERQRKEAEIIAADRKAEQLLVSLLSAEQKREWLEKRWVSETAASGRRYRLYPEWSGGVSIQRADNQEVRRITLCIHPRERVPNCDAMVSNLLLIRADEDRLIRLAIRHDNGEWTAAETAIRVQRPEFHARMLDGLAFVANRPA